MTRLVAPVVCVLVAGLQAAAGTQPAAREPIVDVHLHALPLGYGGGDAKNPITGHPAPASDEAVMRETFAALERYNIVKAVTSGPLDLVKKYHAANPSRVVPSLHLDQATLATPGLAGIIAAEHAAGRIAGLGEVGAQYMGLRPDDPKLEPYWDLAEKLDIPVGFHTGLAEAGTPYEECCPGFRVALGRPLVFEELLVRRPKLRVYLMHAGHPFADETIAILSMYPQVYVEVGAIDWIIPRPSFHAFLRRLVEAGFSQRIMFGSDQGVWPEVIAISIESIDRAEFLTAAQKRDIFYNNAVRFFRLGTGRTARLDVPAFFAPPGAISRLAATSSQ
jgi:hypothetical protein